MQASSRNTSSSATKNCGPGHQPQPRGPPARTEAPAAPHRVLGGREGWDRSWEGVLGEGSRRKQSQYQSEGLCLAHVWGCVYTCVHHDCPPPGLLPHWTHGEQKASVLLDGPDAAHEADGHHKGASDDEQVGGRQRWEGGGQGGEVALRGR